MFMRKPPKQEPRKDKCNRRIGFVRQPKGKYILLSTNEYMTLEWMHRHGGYATTPFIHRFNSLMGFTKSKDCRTTSYRFCNLFHEDDTDHGGPYIDWPYQQTHGVNYPDSKYRTHRTSKFAIEALKEAYLYHENIPEPSSSHWHDILRSACTQSIDLACMEKPDEYRFMHHDTVINNVIAKTGGPPSFKVGKERFVPDAMFGIHYLKQNTVRLFALEADMGTKSIESKGTKVRDIKTTLELYRQYIKGGLYKKDFAFSGGFFLNMITINPTHMKKIMDVATEEPFLLFNWAPHFVFDRKPPEPMLWLFTDSYDRQGHEPFDISLP
jgi:hypothetical protein